MDDRVEVCDTATLLAALDIRIDEPVSFAALVELLRNDGALSEESRPALRGPALSRKVVVPRTRVFVNASQVRRLRTDLTAFLATYIITTNVPLSTAVALLLKAKEAIALLNEDEAEMVRVISSLARGRPYERWVEESRIDSAYVEASIDYAQVLDSLRRREVLERDHSGRVRLVF